MAIEQDGPFGASQAPWQGKPLLPGGGTLIMVCGGVGVVPWADALRADSPDLLPYRDIVLVWAIQNKARAPSAHILAVKPIAPVDAAPTRALALAGRVRGALSVDEDR